MNRSVVGLVFAVCAASASGQVLNPQVKGVTRVVGYVAEVVPRDDRYSKFRETLAQKMADVPSAEEFMQKERWVTVTDDVARLTPLLVRAQSTTDLKIERGDVVEVTVSEEPKSYKDVTRVVRVLCRRLEPTYKDCVNAQQLGAWDASGKRASSK